MARHDVDVDMWNQNGRDMIMEGAGWFVFCEQIPDWDPRRSESVIDGEVQYQHRFG